MNRFTTRQLVLDAMLCAMCAVLGWLALDFGSVKLTFESVPVLLGGLLFGPLDGMAVGGVGTLLYQLLRYGVSATTALWVLPYALCGLCAGAYAKRRGFVLTRRQTAFSVGLCEMLITALNTFTLYLDSKIYGYYFPGIILGALALRLALWAARTAVYSLALPPLLVSMRRLYVPPQNSLDGTKDSES